VFPRKPPLVSIAFIRCWNRASSSCRHQRQRLRHQIQIRQPLRLPRIARRRHQTRDRRDGRRQGRLRLRLRDWPRAAPSLRGFGARVIVTRLTPSTPCRPRWKVLSQDVEDTLGEADIYVDHHRQLRHHHTRAHGENETRPSSATSATPTTRSRWDRRQRKGVTRLNIKPQVDKYTFVGGQQHLLLAEGRLVNPAAPPAIRASSCPIAHQPMPRRNWICGQNKDTANRRLSSAQEMDAGSRPAAPEKIGVKLTKLTKKAGRLTSAYPSKAPTSRSTTGINQRKRRRLACDLQPRRLRSFKAKREFVRLSCILSSAIPPALQTALCRP